MLDMFNGAIALIMVVLIIMFVLTFLGVLEIGIEDVPDKDNSWTMETVTTSEPITVQLESKTMRVSGYAPLDANAKEGVCYSGDPRITASGSRTTPMKTVAADKSIPFGTRLKIEGFNEMFVVEDRGGKIKGNRIDICFATQQEALDFGIKKLAVTIISEDMK